MNRFKNLMTVFAFSLLVLGLPTLASAQWTDRDNDTYNRNGRNNGNYDNGNLKSTVERLKNQSRDFDRQLERELKRNRNDRYNNNSQILGLSDDFKDAADKLEDNFGSGRNLNNTQDEARRVLQLGSQLENVLYSSRSNYNLQGNWNQIHQDLNTIADAYGYNNNRNNRNNRNRNGNWRDRVPFPLPF